MAADRKEEGLLLLGKLDSKQILIVLNNIVDGICRHCHPTREQYKQTWTLQEWWDLKDAFESIFKQAVSETWTKDKTFQELGFLKDDIKQQIVDVVNCRRDEIHHQLVAETSQISQAVLKDFDWKMKLVMSSDKISSVQEPVLSLDLDIQNGSSNQITSLELNKDELHQLITSFENANKVVQQLKA